ncbi:MAG: hypothetical protein HY676_05590 [Chloroflexi bacterium]|nr:hypothetical protein [Chloroflexota bacterium]
MSSLAKALREERWERATVCLLLGLARAMSRVPPDSILGLMEAVEGVGDAQERKPQER